MRAVIMVCLMLVMIVMLVNTAQAMDADHWLRMQGYATVGRFALHFAQKLVNRKYNFIFYKTVRHFEIFQRTSEKLRT